MIFRDLLLHVQRFLNIKILELTVLISHYAVALSVTEDICCISSHNGCIKTVFTGRRTASLHVTQDRGSGFNSRCTSILHSNLSKFLWYKGYNEALHRLQPVRIIRYGSIMKDERQDISIYFENERLKMLKNGR